MGGFEEIQARIDAKRDQVYKEIARADSHTTEGLKALLTLNGGGCVAMLGFLQALLAREKAAFVAFKFYGSNALLFFAVGLVIAALLPVARVLDIQNTIATFYEQQGHNYWDRLVYLLWGLAWLSFVAGLIFVGYGIDGAVK